jgi:phosphoribosyl-AMP cyclohydrolase
MGEANVFDETVALDFSKLDGLAPVVLQHRETREVLMIGFVDEEAWEQTLRTGLVTLFRRTLQRVQVKGADDRSCVRVERIVVDCDNDSVLLEVLPEGPVCHFGGPTCFIRPVEELAQASDGDSGQQAADRRPMP